MNFDITQIFSTAGGTLFGCGVIGAAVSVILMLILSPIFSSEKKKLNRKIRSEFDKK